MAGSLTPGWDFEAYAAKLCWEVPFEWISHIQASQTETHTAWNATIINSLPPTHIDFGLAT